MLEDFCYCSRVLLIQTYGYAWRLREGFLSYRTVICCLQQQDRHQSTGMYLFEEENACQPARDSWGQKLYYSVNMLFFQTHCTLIKIIVHVCKKQFYKIASCCLVYSLYFLLAIIYLFSPLGKGGGDTCKQRSPGYTNLL